MPLFTVVVCEHKRWKYRVEASSHDEAESLAFSCPEECDELESELHSFAERDGRIAADFGIEKRVFSA